MTAGMPAEPPVVGGYRLESEGDVWFLVDPDTGRHRSTFWHEASGIWRGVPPRGDTAIERTIGDVADPHIAMARELVKAAERVAQ